MTRARAWRIVRVVVPLAFLGVFFVYPVATILGRSITAGAIGDVLTDGALRGVAWFTLWQAVVSTILTLALGIPAAYVVARYDFPGRRVFRAFLTVPFVLPTVVVATAFLALIGPGGPLAFLGWERGIGPMLAAHVFFNVAIVVRAVGGFWETADPRRVEAARMLGASRVRAFTSVTLPYLAPVIAASAAIVFLFTFSSFGVALLLAGVQHPTLEVEIYRQAIEVLDLPTAAALALAQILAVLALLFVLGRLQDRQTIGSRLVARADTARRPRSATERALVAGTLLAVGGFVACPLLVLVTRSFRVGDAWSLAAYRALDDSSATSTLFVPAAEALRNSLVFAAVATAIAVVIGGLAAFAIAARPGRGTRALDAAMMLPLGTSAVTVGLGFLVALDRPPLDLRTKPILIPLAQAVVAIPFVIRLVVPALRSIDPRLRDAATVLGAPPRRVWREVDLPVSWRALVVAAGFAAAMSLGEFGATAFIVRPDMPTVPIAINRFLARPGALNVGQALSLSTILMALTIVVILGIEQLRARNMSAL